MSIARRPGGRTARTRAAVLAAVEAELLDNGVDGLTVDGVAERSGVHRATVYRRWHDVGGLLADALAAGREDDWQPADHGSLAADLVALNRDVVEHLAGERSLSRALIIASYRSPAAAAALREFLDDRYRRCEVVVDRAVARGDLPPVRLSPRAMRLPLDLVRAEAVMGGGKPVPDDVLGEMVDQIYLPLLRGFTSDPATTSPRAEPPNQTP